MYPENLKYTKEHEWVLINNNIATIGITYFAQRELGDIVFVESQEVGSVVVQDGVFGTVEAVKTVSDLFSPITGVILEINYNVLNAAELLNTDPYGEGWIVKIDISDPKELESILSAEYYKVLI
jgi:glycine cleavage system H protein